MKLPRYDISVDRSDKEFSIIVIFKLTPCKKNLAIDLTIIEHKVYDFRNLTKKESDLIWNEAIQLLKEQYNIQ